MTKRGRGSWVVLAALAVAGLLLAACGGATTPGAQATEATQPAKVATFIFTQEMDTLNPAYTNQFYSLITHQLWNCWAWDFDDRNSPHPVLVTELPSLENGGLSQDGKVHHHEAEADLVWSDGEALTSADFVFTDEMHTDPANAVGLCLPLRSDREHRGPGSTTVVITFTEPYVPVGRHAVARDPAAHVLRPVFEPDGTIDNANWNHAPTVGCGPFVFEEWESGSTPASSPTPTTGSASRRSTRSSFASCPTTPRRSRR